MSFGLCLLHQAGSLWARFISAATWAGICGREVPAAAFAPDLCEHDDCGGCNRDDQDLVHQHLGREVDHNVSPF